MSSSDILHDLKFYFKMKKSALLYTLALFLGVKTSLAQNQAAAAPQTKPIALTGATIHAAQAPVS